MEKIIKKLTSTTLERTFTEVITKQQLQSWRNEAQANVDAFDVELAELNK